MTNEAALRAVKITHTVAWAFFAGCIVAIPYFAWRSQLRIAWILVIVVMVEVAVLFMNRMRCPLTDDAGQPGGAALPCDCVRTSFGNKYVCVSTFDGTEPDLNAAARSTVVWLRFSGPV